MEYHHLTIPQQNIWNLQKYYGDTAIGNQCGAIFYKEKRSNYFLKQAIQEFIQSQSGIRLRFSEKDGPVQYISDEINEEIPVMTFVSMEEFDHYAKEFAREPIELIDKAMYRFVIFQVEDKSGILVVLGHLISDAWTFSLMANQIDEAYHNLSKRANHILQENDYIEYMQTEKEYQLSDRYMKDKLYWEEKYANRPEKSIIKISASKTDSIEAKRLTKTLSCDLEYAMEKYCKTHPVTPAVLFEAALIIYLSRINPENSSITIGTLVLNRRNAREKKIAGMFVSTMPLTVTVQEDMTVEELTEQITKGHMDIFRHQKYPYSEILKSLREKQNFTGNLYDVMISYQNAKTNTEADTKWYSNGYSEVPFVIHIDNRDGRNSYTINIDYQTAVFKDEREVTYIIERLEYILSQMIGDGIQSMKDIKIVPQPELTKVMEEFNDTYIEYPREKCVHELFTEQAERTPNNVALVFENKRFTYRQLDEMSNSLAHFLREKGVKPNDVVPIIAKRSWHVIVAMLGILKAGGAYMPIDPSFPADRIEYMLSETNSKIILVYGYIQNISDMKTVDLEKFDYGYYIRRISNINHTADYCYVLFTSGSTGKPKATIISHANLANFVNNNRNNMKYQCFMVNNCERVLADTIYTFDVSMFEIYLTLLNGLTIILSKDMADALYLAKLIERYKVDVIHITPTKMLVLLQSKVFQKAIANIKLLMIGAEEFSEELYRIISSYTNAVIYNGYGPTETTIGCSFKRINYNDESVNKTFLTNSSIDITIGSPIANTQIYILDKDCKPLPIGVSGELCIAGEGVGKGYLNHPELTAEKFVPNPFATEENHHGKVMYHTGDLARWRADGEIEYLGRIDTQVKIRGLRIELGEIESVMSSFEGIQLTAVSDKRDENNKQYLVGYYTAEGEIDEKELRSHLSSKLPKYMVPNYFMHLEIMPMTPSGKTDRKNLPLPDFTVQMNEYVAPETEQETKLCHLLEALLHMDRVGVEDNFFEYGGDSLTAIEYVAKAHGMGIEFSLQNVFDYPTVRELCSYLSSGKEEKVHYEISDFIKYRKIFDRNVVDASLSLKKKSLGNILLTGATGFLGAHVLDQLMQEENGKIYCLVRSNKTNKGCGRLHDILEYYFGDKYESEFNHRIIPIVGDIEREGLSDCMPSDVQTVIHTAASVKHYGSYSYFHKVNTEGTQHVIDYAKTVGAKLIHISTLSVSGNSLADDFTVYRSEKEKFFYETSFYIDQPLDNVYIHSKFEAEKRVYDAMVDGLDAAVIRVGNLTNRSSDYKFQPNFKENAFLTRCKALLEFRLFPDYLIKLYAEFSPVDKTAEGIVKIAQYAAGQTVFHLNSNRVIYFDRFLEVVHELGIPMKVVDGNTFNKELQKTIKNGKTEYIYEAFQNDMDENGQLGYDSNIHIENNFTLWFLKKIGFEWNETDMEYIKGYIEYFRNIGYLEV